MFYGFSGSGAGIFFLNVMFQNRYSNPCDARIALRPVIGAFNSAVGVFHNDFSVIRFDIKCGPGEFGVAKIPIPVNTKAVGKKLTLEVGATVNYPIGNGQELRFQHGTYLRYDEDFSSPFWRSMQILSLLAGRIHLSRPPNLTFELPNGVADVIPMGTGQQIEILWSMEQSRLEKIASQS
jgi:hypothetical protein